MIAVMFRSADGLSRVEMLPHLVAPHTLKRAMAPRMEAWMARTEPSATLPLDIDIRVYEYRNRQRVDGQDLYIYEESR